MKQTKKILLAIFLVFLSFSLSFAGYYLYVTKDVRLLPEKLLFTEKNVELLFEGENVFVVEELPLMLRQLNHESALTLIEMFKIRQALDASKRTHSEVKTYMKRLHGKKTEFIMED